MNTDTDNKTASAQPENVRIGACEFAQSYLNQLVNREVNEVFLRCSTIGECDQIWRFAMRNGLKTYTKSHSIGENHYSCVLSITRNEGKVI